MSAATRVRCERRGVELTGDGGLLTGLVREVLQPGLEIELSEHPGYEPYDPAGHVVGPSASFSVCTAKCTPQGEDTEGRANERNGHRPRVLPTLGGDIEFGWP